MPVGLEDNEMLLRCACHSADHLAFLVHEPDDTRGNNLKGQDDDWYLSILLDRRPWWRRVVLATKYVLGVRVRYGAYAELVLRNEDVERLASFITRRRLLRTK